MNMKKLSFLVFPMLLLMGAMFALSSFKSSEATFKVSCQFRPVSGDFANVEFENCNNLKGAEGVAAGSNFSASLVNAGCQVAYISTSLPAIHPAGTVKVYRNGALLASHTVAENQPANFFDGSAAQNGDQFLVTW